MKINDFPSLGTVRIGYLNGWYARPRQRLTHKPTGIVVEASDRSIRRGLQTCLRVLIGTLRAGPAPTRHVRTYRFNEPYPVAIEDETIDRLNADEIRKRKEATCP